MTDRTAGIPASVWDAVETDTLQARGLPNSAYVDPDFAPYERDNLLARSWACVGFLADLPEGAAAMPVNLLGMPLMVVRDAEGTVRAFHNVCSHRGQVLVSGACKLEGAIKCPYHSWTYRLDGSLRGTPFIGGPGVHEIDGFDRSRHGLKPVRTAIWLDMIFVNVSGDALAFEQFIAPVQARFERFCGAGELGRLRVAADSTLSMTVQANWKLAVENFCESYHLPWVHPGLNSYSRLEDHYNIIEPDHFAGQGTTVYDFAARAGIVLPEFPQWSAGQRKYAEYIALFPNILLGVQVDHVFAVLLEPLAHDCTRERVRLYFVDEGAGEQFKAAREVVLEGWREVFAEDIWAVEGLQRGRHSPGFTGGVFSPVMDTPTHSFHCWAARRLRPG